ncbi:MAG TPA: GAF domain-containing protein, partial [Dongiaceae bacterium]|nr:GAF domain-containing protein [Dongiaceae bacterium]
VQALASLASIILENSLMLEFQRDLLIRLSRTQNTADLFERILDEALAITRAEGGSLYLAPQNGAPRLEFVLLKNQVLKLNLGGRHGQPVDMAPLQLEKNGEANLANVATYTALSRETVNIRNAYHDIRFDFSGMKAFDNTYRYRSRSFLSVPLINQSGNVLGVLQLVNARDPEDQITAFEERQEPIVQALASYAAIALENQLLREDHARLQAQLEAVRKS